MKCADGRHLHVTESIVLGATDVFPTLNVSSEDAGADYIIQGASEFFDGFANDREYSIGLAIHISDMKNFAFVIGSCCAGNFNAFINSKCSRIGGFAPQAFGGVTTNDPGPTIISSPLIVILPCPSVP